MVTTFEFELHPLKGVVSGPLDFPYSRDFLSSNDEFVEGIPDEFSCDMLWRRSPQGEPLITLLACFCGSAEATVPVYERLRSRFQPIRDGVSPRSYLESQRMYDQVSPWGWCNYWKTSAMGPFDSGAVAAATEVFEAAASPLSQLQFEHLHGAMHRGA